MSSTPAVFGSTCSVCHGGTGEGTDRAPALMSNRQLRGKSEDDIAKIINGGRGNMPSFAFLPADQIQTLAHYVRSLNADAFDAQPTGDVSAGAAYFSGTGRCAECHSVQGNGGSNGPDLSNVGHQLTLRELTEAIQHFKSHITAGYALVNVRLADGSVLRGFARNQGMHGIDLQTKDGRLHLLREGEYTRIEQLDEAGGPVFNGSDDQRRDVIAFLSRQSGVIPGIHLQASTPIPPDAQQDVLKPRPGEWPSYSGTLDGNRFSRLGQIDSQNVSQLRPAWVHPIPYNDLETTPLVADGVMYVTGPNQLYALNARSGSQIWSWVRPRSSAGEISGDAAKGANRGAALLGDHIFLLTDNAHLVSLNRLTGAVQWEVVLPEKPGRYGGTSAPLVIGNLVVAGISGADEGVRGFVVAYDAATGKQAWRFYTVPAAGEPAAKTWKNSADPQGGSTWTTGSYDVESQTLYLSVGNPYPDTDGDQREGDNLYTNSDIALNAATGKLRWYFQYTAHDLHDWDANQPIVLVDTPFHGKPRKLLLHANRNGFLYILDRTNGRFLQGSALVKKLTWASGLDSKGSPILVPGNTPTAGGTKTCPAVRGATNWYSTSYNPNTRLYYVMTVEDCTLYRKAHDGGYGRIDDPSDPPLKILRAFSLDDGKVAWELPLPGPPERNYAGVLSTAGNLVFYVETSGGFAAAEASTGQQLWHFEANQPTRGSPMTYTVNGQQYVAIASGSNILSFALPAQTQRSTARE
jgi:PQQ-dependent dehydrogenase (methanol/ethanol family)